MKITETMEKLLRSMGPNMLNHLLESAMDERGDNIERGFCTAEIEAHICHIEKILEEKLHA